MSGIKTSESIENISLKELLNSAKAQLKDLTTVKEPDFRLEQAEFKRDENIWEIVVSFLVENVTPLETSLVALSSMYKFKREYKTVKINDKMNVIGFYIYNNK